MLAPVQAPMPEMTQHAPARSFGSEVIVLSPDDQYVPIPASLCACDHVVDLGILRGSQVTQYIGLGQMLLEQLFVETKRALDL